MARSTRNRSDREAAITAHRTPSAERAARRAAERAAAGGRAARNTSTARGVPELPDIRFAPVATEQLPAFVDLLAGSYPLFMTDRDRALQGFHDVLKIGYPSLIAGTDPDGRVAGAYAYYPMVATILGRGIPASGLGMVGTALDRKKQRIALQIVRDYVRRTRRDGMPLSFLYPFRHDFYGDMGWGSVCEGKQYSIPPSSLPLYLERLEVHQVENPDWEALDRVHRRRIGIQGALGLSRHRTRWNWLLRPPQRAFVYGPTDNPEGYVLTKFVRRPGDPDDFHYNLEVLEMEWATPEAMRGLLGFLSSQRDQVMEIVLDWRRDGNLDAILREPARRGVPHLAGHLAHGPVVALGIMMRLEDPETAFGVRPVLGEDALALQVATNDPLRDGRAVRFRTTLRGAQSQGVRARQASLAADLETLSRLWAGSLGFREAVDFALAEISPSSAAGAVDRLFAAPAPWITERF